MHKMFFARSKSIIPYALFNDCAILVWLQEPGKPEFERSTYKDKKNICSFTFIADDNPMKKCYWEMTFVEFVKLVCFSSPMFSFDYIRYGGENESIWSTKKVLELYENLKLDDFRKKLLEKNPILDKALDKPMKSCSILTMDYWKAVPMKDFLDGYVRFEPTEDFDCLKFEVNGEIYHLNTKSNTIRNSDGAEVDPEESLLYELGIKDDDIYNTILKRYGVDLSDYVTDIRYCVITRDKD